MGSVAIQQEQKVFNKSRKLDVGVEGGCIGKMRGGGAHGVPLGAHGGQAVHENRTEEGKGHM